MMTVHNVSAQMLGKVRVVTHAALKTSVCMEWQRQIAVDVIVEAIGLVNIVTSATFTVQMESQTVTALAAFVQMNGLATSVTSARWEQHAGMELLRLLRVTPVCAQKNRCGREAFAMCAHLCASMVKLEMIANGASVLAIGLASAVISAN